MIKAGDLVIAAMLIHHPRLRMAKRIPAGNQRRTGKEIAKAAQAQMNFQSGFPGLPQAALKIARPALLLLFMDCIDNTAGPGCTNLFEILPDNLRAEQRMKIRDSYIHKVTGHVSLVSFGSITKDDISARTLLSIAPFSLSFKEG